MRMIIDDLSADDQKNGGLIPRDGLHLLFLFIFSFKTKEKDFKCLLKNL